jgi:hypothetical protein
VSDTPCRVCGDGMLGIGYTCTGCGRVGESTDIYDRHRSVCIDRDDIKQRLSALEAENERLRAERDNAVENRRMAEQQRDAERWSCPDCAFTFDASHTNMDGTMTCVLCERATALSDLARVREENAALDVQLQDTQADYGALDAECERMRPVYEAALGWRVAARADKRLCETTGWTLASRTILANSLLTLQSAIDAALTPKEP